MGIWVARERRAFEERVVAAAARLPKDSLVALVDMLVALSDFAERQATDSGRHKKWMMLAYWKVVAVYARHFRRLVRTAGKRRDEKG